ncbi:thioredoxin domain-containing protein [Methanoregula sp.]|uniref:thioredoxin domain-containing protein n=1 Tax=Methanoregula sp. TaxID=2052170 RepID=UPI002638CCA0|nr:thioredoxin domain-containing protein [Methanoregula sp.]MDD5141945.1 thioredoxin domain-containing protein [Methanoregula sp.]
MQDREPGGEGKKGNRLSREKSPYLLQHAENPVDWFPWGEEAFSRAVREDKPIFLSIGYATCHWCHVMAHESFEDPEVAELLNRDFVAVKVDREERPDIDSTYMQVCQMLAGQGGWPLTIVMTPEKKPFFAATYIPKERRFALFGLLDLLPRITKAWREQRGELLRSAESITLVLETRDMASAGPEPDAALLDEGYEDLLLRFDPGYGGFSGAPKFPTPHTLLFLLRYWKRTGKKRALDMVVKTLDAIRDGGIHDHVGGGFHRYSTDAQWRVPHFEKMLYDQALLLMAYTEAFQATGNDRYRETVMSTVRYVLRDLTSPEGAFLSAEDADSPGGEGAFYLWTTNELEEFLGKDDAALAGRVFNARKEGNFSSPESPAGENILYRTLTDEALSSVTGMPAGELAGRITSVRERLFAARGKRQRPRCDDKVLLDWNALVIAALAKAARVFGRDECRLAAERAMDFLLTRMRTDNGRLWHRYRDGECAIMAFADDYAFLGLALLELYECTFDPRYLAEALAVMKTFRDHFLDNENGGFFFSADDAEAPLVRNKEIYDGAVPSANSVACEVLLRLSRFTGNTEHGEIAALLARSFAGRVRESSSAFCWFLCAIERAVGPSQEIVIAGDRESLAVRELLAAVHSRYLPHCTVIQKPASDKERAAALATIAPFTWDIPADQHAAAYLCSGTTCSVPFTDPGLLGKELERERKNG